ncbi:rsmI, partial [Symbiodinium sp. CCMP2456]
ALLQLTCNAVVELDADLRITADSQELASMLLRSNSASNLAGVSFTDFVTAAEKDRAAEILNSRLLHATGGLDNEVQTVSAQAFHTRLVDSCSSKFRTEVFQVSYRKLDGEICHLIGLRDFTDQSCLAGQAVDAIEDPMTSPSASQSWAPSSSQDSMRSSQFDIEEGLPGQQFLQPPEKPRSRWVLLELDIPSMQIYGASAPIGWLAGKRLANIFPEDVTDGFQKLWNDIVAVEEKGELDRTVLSFSNIEMRLSPKKTSLISGTVEVTRSVRSTTAGTSLGTFPMRTLSPMSSESVCRSDEAERVKHVFAWAGDRCRDLMVSLHRCGLMGREPGPAFQIRSALNGLNSAASAAAWGMALILLEDMQAASIETSNIALQAAMEVFNEGAPMPSWLLELLTASLVAEEPSVVATASYKLQLHGRFDAHSAAVLERKVLRGCWIRFRELRQREAPGPAPDAVLQRQASLGAGIAELLSKAAFLGCALQGRLAVRRLHHMEGTFDESCSLAAKSVPAWVESQLTLQLPSSSSAGRVVGHRSGTLDVWSPILADHDRSQHAERQALLLLLGDLDTSDTGPVPPAGGIRLYVSAHPCISCTAVFFQLASSWRGVRLQVAFDAWEETKRWTASLAPEEEGEEQQRLHSLERAPD